MRTIYNPALQHEERPDAIVLIADGDQQDATIYEVARWADDSHAGYELTPEQATHARNTVRAIISIDPETALAVQHWLGGSTH